MRPDTSKIVKTVIGIQARSTSHRLPRKVHMLLTNRSILEHVVQAGRDCATYLNRFATQRVFVYLLVPEGDEIIQKCNDVPYIEGPESDVLTRYVMLDRKVKAAYYCRITADCPLIPHFLITKLIKLAAANEYDYVSNVDPRCRTAPDGTDCEVMSARLLCWLDENATEAYDREHVTTLARREPPEWARQGIVVNFQDSSDVKFSVDTLEDLAEVRERLSRVETKYDEAVRIFGRHCVHRF